MSDETTSRKTTNLKTGKPPSRPKIIQSEKSNVLNKYRSFTYNFTLAGLRKEAVNNPDLYKGRNLDLIIIKSGGKGITGLSTDVSGVSRKVGEQVTQVDAGFDQGIVEIKKGIFKEDKAGDSDLVRGFNQNSPGRFDMFIEGVEVNTLMNFSKAGGVTMPTSINFRVVEPYSVNGFIEALHVAAVASGYTNYLQASFLLKMEFIGYEDTDTLTLKDPKLIENTTRYFPIKFSGVEMEIGEKGTNYRCTAIPWNEQAFGQPNKLRRTINMSGTTVKEILEDFARKLTEQYKNDDKQIKEGSNVKDSDEFEIKFPVKTDNGYDYNQVNLIGQTNLTSISRDNNIFKFPDLGETKQKLTPQQIEQAAENSKFTPRAGSGRIQFSEGQQINEIIAAVIRDSDYVKGILEKKKIDDDGFIDYFMIKSDVINKGEIDPVSRKPYQKIRYSVLLYKIHYTKIPGLESQKYNTDKLERLSLREYNYIYKGTNVDVLSFKLNFNSAFYEAIPAALGNNNQPGQNDSAGQPNTSSQKIKGDDVENLKRDKNGNSIQRQIPLPIVTDGASARQPSSDPYYNLARNLHSVITDSKSNLITANIEILGDPFYLVTGGIGNQDSKSSNTRGLTADGEADHLIGELLITINFRNPVDIKPLEQGGMYYFESEKLPFSGVYRVMEVRSTFNEGLFKQELTLIRYPGQIIGKVKETRIEDKFLETPNPLTTQAPSTTQGVNQGGTPISTTGALNLLSRGLPSPGLPGVLSNFTNAIGGLGGQASGLLNQVGGFVSKGINNLTGANSVFGGLSQAASGIRMKLSGLTDLANSSLGSAAGLVQGINTIASQTPLSGAVDSVSADIIDKKTNLLNKLSITGSGIGQGASVLVNRVNSLDQSLNSITKPGTAVVNVLETTNVANGALSLFGNSLGGINANAVSAVSSLGGASQLISGAKDKITQLTSGIPTDPQALAAKFGIDTSQLSGLTGDLQSKVLSQLQDLSKKIPEDTNLGVATARGLVLDYVPNDKLSNLPATAPYLTAPSPAVDKKFLEDITKSGGNQALASAFGVADIKNISGNLLPTSELNSIVSKSILSSVNPLSNLPGNLNLTDVKSLGAKIASSGNLINQISPSLGSVESKISSIASKVGDSSKGLDNLNLSVASKFSSLGSGQSPLDKLFTSKG